MQSRPGQSYVQGSLTGYFLAYACRIELLLFSISTRIAAANSTFMTTTCTIDLLLLAITIASAITLMPTILVIIASIITTAMNAVVPFHFVVHLLLGFPFRASRLLGSFTHEIRVRSWQKRSFVAK